MIKQAFAAKDTALDAFMTPFFTPTIAHAIRMFQDALQDKTLEIAKHAEDFNLYHIGSWDDHNCQFTNLPDGIKMIARGKDNRPPNGVET